MEYRFYIAILYSDETGMKIRKKSAAESTENSEQVFYFFTSVNSVSSVAKKPNKPGKTIAKSAFSV